MSSISDATEAPKDRTKWTWLAVIVLIAAMVTVLWLFGHRRPPISRVNARHILIKCDNSDPVDRARAIEMISEVRRRILDGESFKKLAREYSDDETSRPRGGDLGYHEKGKFESEFEAYVWSAPIGELSDVTQTSYGFHIIEVIDRFLSEPDRYEMELDQKVRHAGPESAPADAVSTTP